MDLELEFAQKLITWTAYFIAVAVMMIIILESDDDTGW